MDLAMNDLQTAQFTAESLDDEVKQATKRAEALRQEKRDFARMLTKTPCTQEGLDELDRMQQAYEDALEDVENLKAMAAEAAQMARDLGKQQSSDKTAEEFEKFHLRYEVYWHEN